jgi:ketosteroid isomerase-like protein
VVAAAFGAVASCTSWRTSSYAAPTFSATTFPKRALGDEIRSWTYAQPDIKEILVFGDVAVVRLTWTSTVRGGPEGEVKSVEPGMDIFRRQPDGSWKIMRYMAFSQ